MSSTHMAVSVPNRYGGFTTTTLCGRYSEKPSEDGFNSDTNNITCKICLAILGNHKHWRHRKYLAQADAPLL